MANLIATGGNAFTNAVKTLANVTKAAKAGEITQDQGYKVLESIGLHKGPSGVEKAGKALTLAVASVASVGLGTAAVNKLFKSDTVAAPVISKVVEPKTQPVGLIDTITKGINKVSAFSKTDLGSSLIGTAGKIVSNLATPSPGIPSTVPQQLALIAGTNQVPPETLSQAAVFQGKGVSVKLGSDANGETWWTRNKSWVLPVLLAVPGFFVLLFMLFGGRRR